MNELSGPPRKSLVLDGVKESLRLIGCCENPADTPNSLPSDLSAVARRGTRLFAAEHPPNAARVHRRSPDRLGLWEDVACERATAYFERLGIESEMV